MDIWKVLRIIWKLVVGYTTGGIYNRLLVHGPEGTGLVGLIDDVVIICLGTAFEMGWTGTLALTVFTGELVKIVVEGIEWAEMDEDERQRQLDIIQEKYPENVYLYGNVSDLDGLKLWISGRYLAKTDLGETVFQAVRDLFEVVAETAEEVAIVA